MTSKETHKLVGMFVNFLAFVLAAFAGVFLLADRWGRATFFLLSSFIAACIWVRYFEDES